MLHFFIFFFRTFGQSSVAAEIEVRQVDLVDAFLGVNHLAVVQNVKLDIPLQTCFSKVLPIFLKFDIKGGICAFCLCQIELFFKNGAIFGRQVLVRVLQRFTILNFSKLEALFVGVHVQDKLSFSGVVGHASFNNEDIALF